MKKTKLKRSEATTLKAIDAHPEAVLGAIPQGFVLIRLHSEIKQVLDELKATRRIGDAIDTLQKRPEYANLQADIVAVLRGDEPAAELPEAPELVDDSEPEEKVGLLRRMFG